MVGGFKNKVWVYFWKGIEIFVVTVVEYCWNFDFDLFVL